MTTELDLHKTEYITKCLEAEIRQTRYFDQSVRISKKDVYDGMTYEEFIKMVKRKANENPLIFDASQFMTGIVDKPFHQSRLKELKSGPPLRYTKAIDRMDTRANQHPIISLYNRLLDAKGE